MVAGDWGAEGEGEGMKTKTKPKTVNLSLVGLDSNAFLLLGAFNRQAKREGWTSDEINNVLTKATAGDYDHLLRTLDAHCEPVDNED